MNTKVTLDTNKKIDAVFNIVNKLGSQVKKPPLVDSSDTCEIELTSGAHEIYYFDDNWNIIGSVHFWPLFDDDLKPVEIL